MVQVELKGLVSSLGMWGPSCLPAYPLGVLREPSCAPGQLIMLAHDFSSPPPPSISHILCREEASTGHVMLVLLTCPALLPTTLAPIILQHHVCPLPPALSRSAVLRRVLALHYPHLPCMPNLQFLLLLPLPSGLHLKSHGEGGLHLHPSLRVLESVCYPGSRWTFSSQNPITPRCLLSSLISLGLGILLL